MVQFVLPRSNRNPCPKTANPHSDIRAAVELSKAFHQFDPRYRKRRSIDWPQSVTSLGKCAQIDYIAAKYDGKSRQYFHKFGPGCRVYACPEAQANGDNMLIILGPFKIQSRGLVG